MIFEFLDYSYKNLKLSPATIKAYANALKCFAAYAKSHKADARWSTLKVGDFDEYIDFLTSRKYSSATIRQHIVALRQIYEYFIHLGRMTENPANHIRLPKMDSKLPRIADLDKVKAAISKVEKPAVSFVLAVMLTTGCRVSEARNLTWADIDTNRKTIVFEGKNRKERIAPLAPSVINAMEKIEKVDRNIVQMDDRTLREEIYHAIGDSSHSIRHAFATQLVDRDINLEQIRVMMGHASIVSTQRYLHSSVESIRKNYDMI